ncbi:MAG: flavodoxin family protein [Prevotellaceae bacterium]|nr:flavodoxin family protein [Prevotellaceae bacterium]
MAKVLLINGSPKKEGNTFIALSEIEKVLNSEGIETEIIHIGHKDIHGCVTCYKCGELKRCVFNDIVNDVSKKFQEADGLIIGSPVYYASPAGTLMAFLDRLFLSSKFDKTMKVGAAVTVARRGGMSSTFDVLNKYFTICGMPVVSSQYWNMVYGRYPGEAVNDLEGLQTMRRLGKNMAFLIKSIQLGKESFGAPTFDETPIMTNFIK